MNRKEHLINSLRIAVDALKNDTIHYDWKEQHSCNAGVVAQACLGITREKVNSLRAPLFSVLDGINENREKGKKLDLTWKNAVKYGCPITGLSNFEIIDSLEKAGLSKADIVHLEYLENPAILEISGIQKVRKVEKVKVDESVKFEEVADDSFMGRLFGKKVTKKTIEPIYTDVVSEDYPDNYYTDKKNLILYLSAWIKILTQRTTHASEPSRLEAMLLNAVAEEDYEKAAEIRNELALLVK
jgi:hypothetical protein